VSLVDDTTAIIYDRNMFIIQAAAVNVFSSSLTKRPNKLERWYPTFFTA